MPIYEFKCKDCEHKITLFQKVDDLPPEVCEACGSPNVFKLVSNVAVHFKGSGFYCVDNQKG